MSSREPTRSRAASTSSPRRAREPPQARAGARRAGRPEGRREEAPQLTTLAGGTRLDLLTDRGELKIVAEPAGTRGYDDLRRAATREPLGEGLRPSVASVDDLARMLAAPRPRRRPREAPALRRLAELERPRLELRQRLDPPLIRRTRSGRGRSGRRAKPFGADRPVRVEAVDELRRIERAVRAATRPRDDRSAARYPCALSVDGADVDGASEGVVRDVPSLV